MSTKGSVSLNMKNEKLMKFANYIMRSGKKYLALKLITSAFDNIKSKGHANPEEIFEKALENVMPRIEVRPKRVGGSIYQVPQEVKPSRQLALAIRWILASARAKS
jgi:small subunit ribosomal protein S7